MPTLISCLSTGKGTWGHVSRLIGDNKWSTILLITNEFGRENFTKNDRTELIVVNQDLGIKELREEILLKLRDKIKDSEVFLNMVSGNGKEHMALLSALLKLGLGINLVALTNEEIEEI